MSVLLGFASISTDLYLPAMPSMGAQLGASQGQLELTVSGYLMGFALGQLFWGPVSDRFGRKAPLMLGVAIFVIGAAGCALSINAHQLIVARVVQAIGASSAVVLGRAMVRDLYHRDDAARMLSTLMLIMGVAPMIGPSVGAHTGVLVVALHLLGSRWGRRLDADRAGKDRGVPPQIYASRRQFGPGLLGL